MTPHDNPRILRRETRRAIREHDTDVLTEAPRENRRQAQTRTQTHRDARRRP